MFSPITYGIIILGYYILYLWKKDKLIVTLFEFSPIVVIMLSGGILNLIEELSILSHVLIGISLIIPFLFIFLFSRKRMSQTGLLTCKKCKNNLPAISDSKLFDRRHYHNRKCEKCEQ